jgi:hypothetical protein
MSINAVEPIASKLMSTLRADALRDLLFFHSTTFYRINSRYSFPISQSPSFSIGSLTPI